MLFNQVGKYLKPEVGKYLKPAHESDDIDWLSIDETIIELKS